MSMNIGRGRGATIKKASAKTTKTMWERLAFSFSGVAQFALRNTFEASIQRAAPHMKCGPHQKEIAANKDYKSLKNIGRCTELKLGAQGVEKMSIK